MKYELSELGGLKRKLDIHLSVEQVNRVFDEIYKKKQKKIHLPGFRKGKAPLNHIRSMYQEEVKRDTVVSIINEFYLKAIQQERIKPIGEPKIDLKSQIAENQDFGFSAVMEIQPEIHIDKDFKVQLSKPPVTVDEKEVDQFLENIRSTTAKYETITENRAARWEDIVELNIQELPNPKPVPDKKPVMLELKKERDSEVNALSESVVDMRIGDMKKITTKPEGRPVELEVTLLNIKKRILPDLDDEFFKKFKCRDIQEMKSIIRRTIEKEKQDQAYHTMREETLQQLVDKNPVPLLPEGIMEDQKQIIISSSVKRLKEAGTTETNIEKYKKKHQEDFQKRARFMVHSSYLIYALADKLNISVDQRELQLHLQNTESKQNPSDKDYQRMENFLIMEKTINHLIDTAIKA